MTRLALLTGLALIAAPAQAASDEARAALAESVDYFNAGDMRAARIEALNAVKADRRYGLAYALLARTQLALGDGVAADTSLRRAIAAGITETRLAHLRAHAALMRGDPKSALKFAEQPIPSPASRAYANRIAAGAMAALGDMEGAATAYDAAAASTPDSSALWVDIARFRLRQGDVGGAGASAARAVALDGNNVEALILSGQLVRGQYGLTASLEWFDRALAVDANNLLALGEAAATLGDSGRYTEMLGRTRRMLAIEPDNARALYLQAVMAARAKQYELARTLVYRIGDRMNAVPGMMLLKGALALEAGAGEQAKKALEPLAWYQRTNLTAWQLYGLALMKAGDSKDAFFRLAPLGDRADASSYTLLRLAELQEGVGNWPGAGLLRDRAARGIRVTAPVFDLDGAFRPDTASQADGGNADVAVPRIARLVADGDVGGALVSAREIAGRYRGSAPAQILLGDVYEAQKNYRAAADAYRAASNIEFGENAALRLISALGRSGREAAALTVLDTFLQQNPRNVPALLLAANRLLENGQWDAAIATLNGVRLRIGNRDATVLTGLAWAWFRKGNADKAMLYANAATRLAPGNPIVAGTNGWIRFESGKDPNGGRALLIKAARIAPENAQLREWVGKSRA